MSKNLPERFWSKVDKSGECWVWTAAKNIGGYGAFRMNRKTHVAHRLTFEDVNGSIPDGAVLDHACHLPACVNPAHLRIATDKQNGENRGSLNVNNSSGIRGVYLEADSGKWTGQVQHNRVKHCIGRYASRSRAEEAILELRNSLFTHNDMDRLGVME